jgi:hypothetical protein
VICAQQLDHLVDPLGALDHQDRVAALDRLAQAAEDAELGPLDVDLDEGRAEAELVEAAQVDLDLLESQARRARALGPQPLQDGGRVGAVQRGLGAGSSYEPRVGT